MRPREADPTLPRVRRLWMVNHYADAPDRATGTRHFDLARRLVARGHEVTIFASSFSHVSGREERLVGRRPYGIQRFDGVRFVWLRTVPYRGNGVRRQINMLSFLVMFLLVQMRLGRPDVVIGSTVHPFAALGGWIAARIRGARFMFEIRDLWPQTLVDLGAMREGSAGERMLRAIESFLVRRSVTVVTLLPGVHDYLVERGLPADHVAYVPNGVDIEAFDRPPDGDSQEGVRTCLDIMDRMRRDGRVVFAYVGALGRVNDVQTIVKAVAIAETKSPGRVGIVLIGDGPERTAIERLVAQVDAAVLCEPVPKRSVPIVLRAMDVGIVHATANPVYRYGISFNKLFEYFAAARPVVFACESAYDPVAIAHAGFSIPPNDAALLADALVRIADAGMDGRNRMGAAGRAYVSRFHDIERLAGDLAELIER